MSTLYSAAELLVEEAHHFLRDLSFLKHLSELKTEHWSGCHDSSNSKYIIATLNIALRCGKKRWHCSEFYDESRLIPSMNCPTRLYSQSWMRIVNQQQDPQPRPCLSKHISKSCFVRGSHCQNPALQQARVVNKEDESWKWNRVTATRVVAAKKNSQRFVYQHLSKSHLPPTKTWVNCDDW